MRISKWLLVIGVACLAWLGMGTTSLAAGEAAVRPPQKHEPTPSSWWSGFTTQPSSVNYLGGERGQMEVRAIGGTLFNSYHYVWWLSVDGQPFTKVQTGSKKFAYTIPKLTGEQPVKYYVQVAYEPTSHNFRPTTYWSQVATVTVNPQRVPTEGLTLSTSRDYLINGDTLQVQPQLTPIDSTDLITWESSDPQLATVDAYGWVTTRPVAKPVVGNHQGKVTITATSNGHQASVELTVGALQDVSVVEGSPATFKLPPLLDDVEVSKWYRIDPDGHTKELPSTEHSYTVEVPTHDQDDQAAYYAELKSKDSDEVRLTNAARLNVERGGELALTAVPTFNFGQVQLDQLAQSGTLSLTHQDAADAVNPQIAVSDQRTVGGDWTLGVQMTAFESESNPDEPRQPITARLKLRDAAGLLEREIQADGTHQPVYTGTRGQDGNFDLNGSTLELVTDPMIMPGTYRSTMTWTLSQVPG